ncbi:hypothetical protein B0T18DRAFT_438805 [Schizothecium vesticola]|uniref:NAD-dependent epimerase/dehydratase domain-containing protein n=1 Tax=Schizothecium vesticola TaxID=314040 RepID=A0AA40EXC3_9PEZI|nr:hypothetical protein B0T18DRAFT_438805 [Schizothecium vesticola]
MPALKDDGAAEAKKSQKVLLTGGTGFIASHVLDVLLDHGYTVVVTARSEEKGKRIIDAIPPDLRDRVSYVVVADIAQPGAFDQAVVSDPPFDFVIHTASPYQLQFNDPIADCLDPAIKGTTGILQSIHAFAPTVKRVVITSSSAAILDPPNHPKVYDESIWSSVTLDQATDPAHTYRASKKFAELSAWNFLTTTTPPPSFTLATINNTYTFGPLPRSLASLSSGTINTSNLRILDLVRGQHRAAIPPTAPVFTFVDVRDVALAHVRAMEVPEAGGKRFYVVLGGVLPSEEVVAGTVDDFPEGHWRFDNSRSRGVLGVEYRGLEESVVDTVRSILGMDVEGGEGKGM